MRVSDGHRKGQETAHTSMPRAPDTADCSRKCAGGLLDEICKFPMKLSEASEEATKFLTQEVMV